MKHVFTYLLLIVAIILLIAMSPAEDKSWQPFKQVASLPGAGADRVVYWGKIEGHVIVITVGDCHMVDLNK